MLNEDLVVEVVASVVDGAVCHIVDVEIIEELGVKRVLMLEEVLDVAGLMVIVMGPLCRAKFLKRRSQL